MRQIYLDHASTTPVRPEVVEAMTPYFTEHFGNPSSIYPLGQEASDAVAAARESLAGLIGAAPREIFFTSGGTESDNWAIKGFARANAAKGRHIITSAIEHHAVLHTCQALEREGFEVTYLPVDEHGLVSVEDFKAAMRPDTILASIMFANNEIGTIEPIRQLAAAAHEANVVFHTDAVQAVGHIAAELAVDERAPEHNRQLALRDHAIRRILAEIPSAKLNGSWESRLANNVNFSFEFIEGEGMLLQLAARGICVSSGSACTSGSLDPSHVLLAIGLPHEIAHGSLRLTLGRDTTLEDVDFAVDSLKATLQNLRMMSPLYEDFQQGKVESVIERFKADDFPYAN